MAQFLYTVVMGNTKHADHKSGLKSIQEGGILWLYPYKGNRLSLRLLLMVEVTFQLYSTVLGR